MRYGISTVVLVLLLVAGGYYMLSQGPMNYAKRIKARNDQSEINALRSAANQFNGSIILKNYASPSQSPQQDLTDLSHVFGNFTLLVKGNDPIPLGANEDIANALRGKNRTKLRFLPDDAPCFNAKGQLVDRWQIPLFFHANDQQRLDIRSAGPDKQMWTEDDIHRRYDGQFIQGEALNSTSLFDSTKDYRPRSEAPGK